MRVRVSALVLAGLCAAPISAQQPAQPQAQAQEAAVIEQLRTSIRFENDGTGRRELYLRVKAQSEAGVQQWGQVVFGYNAGTEGLEIPLIRVRKADGTLVDTPSTSVQELSSPVERIAPVYTDFRQKHATVQSFRPGDTLEVRAVTTIHTALAPGQFWAEYTFDEHDIVLDETLDVDVPAARHLILKQRAGVDAAVKEEGGRRTYHWSHTHAVRKEETKDAADQPKDDADDAPDPAPIRLTTFGDWKELGAWFAGIEHTARKVTPEIQEKARTLTAGRTSEVDKLEALYDFVSKNFRYVSLSLGAGRYQPRAAADVLRDAYGDCKDKHTLLAALIDAAGLQASAVLINSRGKIDPDFPSPSQFDHVITRARAAGQDVWLDATPEVAPFRLLSYNLRKKQALVTQPGQESRLDYTPANPPMPALSATSVDGALDEAGTLKADIRVTVRGDVELALRSVFRAAPNPQWKDIVESTAKNAGLDGTVSDVIVSDPQATKEPFTIAFHVDAPGYADLAGRKSDLSLPMAAEDLHQDVPESGAILLGAPGAASYSLKLRVPALAKLRAPVAVKVSRDYGEYRTSYVVSPGLLTVERALTLAERELPQERRPDYVAFNRVLAADGQQHVSIDGTAIAAAPVSSDAKAKQLNRSGYDALQAGEYAQAVTLLQRALELDPKAPSARLNLAKAHLSLHQPAEALAALQKLVALNPYDEYAYFYMARAYVAQRKYADAEAALNKELEINPLDKYAPGALGALFMEQQQYEKAAQAYEKATAVDPEQATWYVQLGKAYLNLHRNREATAAFDRAVELSPNPSTWNGVAYELSLAAVDLERAQRYVESAISATAAASRNLDVEHADARALGTASALASYWDTLGWVYFAKGDLARAEAYVARAWAINQHAEIGDHLGQIYEKLGRRDAAIGAYAAALSASNPANLVREHLTRAAGGAGKVDALVAAHLEDLSKARTFAVAAKGPAGKKADYLVLFAAPGRVEAVKFIEGDEEMRGLGSALEKIPATAVFPDESPAKLLRRGVVACGPAGACTFTLLLPEDARPVK